MAVTALTFANNTTASFGAAASRGMSALSYLGGVASVAEGSSMVTTGADEQQPKKTGGGLLAGIMRLLRGGMMLSLPFMAAASQGSVSRGMANSGPTIAHVQPFNAPAGPAPRF
jgi:hypothetical protein